MIPSIDLMGGKIVQLIQGKTKALEFTDFDFWIERFSRYPLVQLIDLDAAMGQGDNRLLVEKFCTALRCQVGGGVRTIAAARNVIATGAAGVICGSALISGGEVNVPFAIQIAEQIGIDHLICAVDSLHGVVTTHGWKVSSSITPAAMMGQLEDYCGGFLYTHVETEGLMQGIPLQVVGALRAATSRRLAVAGGIASLDEVAKLDALGIDAVVGMAIYSNRMEA